MTYWVIKCAKKGGRAEEACEAHLDRLGYPGAWWPVETMNSMSGARARGIRKAKARAETAGIPYKKPETERKVPIIGGYVFVKADHLDHHAIRTEPGGSLWVEALIINGKPVAIKDEDMKRMEQIPDLLQQEIADLEARIAAEKEARRPVVGQRARVVDGVLEGHCGVVKSITDKGVQIDTDSILGYIYPPIEIVERVA